MTTLLFVVLFAIWCALHMVRTNPVPVLVANIVWLVACAYLVFVKQDWYFGAGAALAVANVAWMALGQKLRYSLTGSNMRRPQFHRFYSGLLLLFDQVYAWLAPKL